MPEASACGAAPRSLAAPPASHGISLPAPHIQPRRPRHGPLHAPVPHDIGTGPAQPWPRPRSAKVGPLCGPPPRSFTLSPQRGGRSSPSLPPRRSRRCPPGRTGTGPSPFPSPPVPSRHRTSSGIGPGTRRRPPRLAQALLLPVLYGVRMYRQPMSTALPRALPDGPTFRAASNLTARPNSPCAPSGPRRVRCPGRGETAGE